MILIRSSLSHHSTFTYFISAGWIHTSMAPNLHPISTFQSGNSQSLIPLERNSSIIVLQGKDSNKQHLMVVSNVHTTPSAQGHWPNQSHTIFKEGSEETNKRTLVQLSRLKQKTKPCRQENSWKKINILSFKKQKTKKTSILNITMNSMPFLTRS